jgi:hypothetical protein
VLTVHQLVAADPEAIARAGLAWHRLASLLATHAADLDGQVDGLCQAWHGAAADAATGRLRMLCTELDEARPALVGITQVLTEHAATVARAQQIAVEARRYAGCARVTIGPDGTAAVDFTGEQPDPGDFAAAEQITAELHRALNLAAGSDSASASRLGELGPARPAGYPDRPPDRVPAHVATWWSALSPTEQRWLIEHQPELVGNLDGVPATARDLANRGRLHTLLADPHTHHRDALLALQSRLDTTRPVPAYLLGLSADGRGRAIVALGDPDTADHVVTCVPGLGGNLDHVTDELSRIGHLSAAAHRAAADRATSVIAWLGYDAPATLPEAARLGPAHQAQSALHDFQTGLRLTHQGGASHNTVVGHSYGSTVVGLTGAAVGLPVDDVVLLGSPGVGVAHAGDLGLDPSHVWASTAQHDAVTAAVDPRQLNPVRPPLLRPLVGVHTDRLWFGPNPVGPDFGAHVFTSTPGSAVDPIGAHVGYYDEGNQALIDMADIAVGDYPAVS